MAYFLNIVCTTESNLLLYKEYYLTTLVVAVSVTQSPVTTFQVALI